MSLSAVKKKPAIVAFLLSLSLSLSCSLSAVEKNPTIVSFPIKNLDLRDLLMQGEGQGIDASVRNSASITLI